MTTLRTGLVAMLGLLAAGLAQADNCDRLVGKSHCAVLYQGTTVVGLGSLSFFGDGVVMAPEYGQGTYTCGGSDLVKVVFTMEEGTQQWVGEVGRKAKSILGHGENYNGALVRVESAAGSCISRK